MAHTPFSEEEKTIRLEKVVVPDGQEYQDDVGQGHWSSFKPGEECWVVWQGEPEDWYVGRLGEFRTREEAEAKAEHARQHDAFCEAAENIITKYLIPVARKAYEHVRSQYPNLPSGGGTDPWQTFVESVEHGLWGEGELK